MIHAEEKDAPETRRQRRAGIFPKMFVVFFLLLVSLPCGAADQGAAAIPRIGFIVSTNNPALPRLDAFRAGLQELGYVESRNIAIEVRRAEGRLERMAPLVRELVDQKVDIIIGTNNVVIRAAKEATKEIPIVVISSVDPVAAGYVQSFAQPGGNITGIASGLRDVSAKRIELLKQLLPRISKIGVLWDPNGPGPAIAWKEYEKAARDFKLQSLSLAASGLDQDPAELLRPARAGRIDALVVVASALTDQLARRIFAAAAKYRMPSMTEERRYTAAGGLISYGANGAHLYRRAAVYVDKILKGAKAAELPMEEPNRIELTINHRIAKQIGVAIPPSLLALADR